VSAKEATARIKINKLLEAAGRDRRHHGAVAALQQQVPASLLAN